MRTRTQGTAGPKVRKGKAAALLAVLALAVTALVMTAPSASATPQGEKSASLRVSGTRQLTDFCDAAGQRIGVVNNFEGSGSGARLGYGALQWQFGMGAGGGFGPWEFHTPAGSLHGTAGLGSPGPPGTAVVNLFVSGGDGQFAHVTGGYLSTEPFDPQLPYCVDGQVTSTPFSYSFSGSLFYG